MAANFPYRRDTSILPYAFKITGTSEPLAPVAINVQELADKGVETFRFVNPAKCWVWLRGVKLYEMASMTYSDIAMKGHLYPPGAIEVMKSQYPEAIAVVVADIPDFPAPTDGVARYCYIIYGGGN